jgi:hypothetical protein
MNYYPYAQAYVPTAGVNAQTNATQQPTGYYYTQAVQATAPIMGYSTYSTPYSANLAAENYTNYVKKTSSPSSNNTNDKYDPTKYYYDKENNYYYYYQPVSKKEATSSTQSPKPQMQSKPTQFVESSVHHVQESSDKMKQARSEYDYENSARMSTSSVISFFFC